MWAERIRLNFFASKKLCREQTTQNVKKESIDRTQKQRAEAFSNGNFEIVYPYWTDNVEATVVGDASRQTSLPLLTGTTNLSIKGLYSLEECDIFEYRMLILGQNVMGNVVTDTVNE